MRHYTEDDLVLHHYGEGRRRSRLDQHLRTCPACSAMYREIAGTLAIVGHVGVPERDDRYGLEVWQRIRHDLPFQEAPWWITWCRHGMFGHRALPGPGASLSAGTLGATVDLHHGLLAGAAVLVIVAAFVVGRFWVRATSEPPGRVQAGDAAPGAGERVRLAAISDHLEQSERVLLDIINSDGQSVDVSGQQAGAAALIDSSRLYRHAAERAGDETVASVLDELERNLLEIVHGPSTLTSAELGDVRARLDGAALLFKVRVLTDELRERELESIRPRKTT
jgi:hypothetical protein